MGLTEKYAEIHFSAAESVRRGDYSPDVVPVTGGSRWGLSLVALPEPAIARRLAKTALALSGAASNRHVAYQPNDIHITVRSLEGHEHQVSEETVTNYLSRIRRLTENLGEIQVDVRGLSATRGGVIACGYPNDTLVILRSRLLQDWQAHGFESIPGGDGDGNRDTAHSSLMVFRPGGSPEPQLVDLIESKANTQFGAVTTRTLALVSYQVSEDSVRLHRRAEISW